MKVYTGNYDNCDVPEAISISGNAGKSIGFRGPHIRELAPKRSWWQVWHDQIGVLSEEENLRFYVESYYETVLKPLDPGEILMKLKEGSILLCYEEPEDFCHRHIVAAWLELFYGIEVREVKVLEDGNIKVLPRNKYYSTIKTMLEILIKDTMDMHGYTAISASYAYEQAKEVAKNPELCNEFGVSEAMYMRLAEVLENMHGEQSKKK